MRVELRVGESGRLDRAVARALRESGRDCSNREAKALVESGAVVVDGAPCRFASHNVAAGAAVSVDIADAPAAPEAPVDLTDVVLYRDEWIVAVCKPSGLPTHATHDPGRDHAQAAVQRLVGAGGYVAVHHRLDVETSGVLVFAVDRAANKGLAEAFADRLAQKTYVALVASSTLQAQTIANHLGRDRHDRQRMCVVRSGGDYAETELDVRARGSGGALVEARPKTGRTHQIRVHLGSVGAPIVGDALYGGPPGPRLMLHAERLVLPHPVTGEGLEIVAGVPDDFGVVLRSHGIEIGGGG